jgi:WD40 repeat protein
LNTLDKHRSAVLWVAWTADGTRFATASRDNTAHVWDAEGNELFVLQGHIRAVNWAAWAPPDADGRTTRLATVSVDGTARIWNAETGELLRTLFGHEDEIRALAWSPGGSRLLTVSKDGTARMWYTESGGQLLTFSGHGDNGQGRLIYGVAWSPDGRYFATAGADSTARVWQIWKNAIQLISIARSCCNQRILSDEENQQFALPTATVAPTPDPAPATCGGETLTSRLYPGARGRVAGTGDDTSATSIFVHTEPGIATPRIGRVALGQTFIVREGPQCFQNIAWFRIIFGISATEGWIAEGEDGAYYLEPIG